MDKLNNTVDSIKYYIETRNIHFCNAHITEAFHKMKTELVNKLHTNYVTNIIAFVALIGLLAIVIGGLASSLVQRNDAANDIRPCDVNATNQTNDVEQEVNLPQKCEQIYVNSMSYFDVIKKRWLQGNSTELPNNCLPSALRVINQQLWCCCGEAGILVFDSELKRNRTIPAGNMGGVHDVAEMSNGDVVIAAGHGLFQLDVTGKCLPLSGT